VLPVIYGYETDFLPVLLGSRYKKGPVRQRGALFVILLRRTGGRSPAPGFRFFTAPGRKKPRPFGRGYRFI
jgi:hypothetical protein